MITMATDISRSTSTGAKGDWISGSLIWSKTLMERIFNPYGEFGWSLEGPVSQIYSPHLNVGAPEIFSDLLRSVQMLKGEKAEESNRKLRHLFIPSKTATLVPEFAVEDLPLGRSAALVPEFAVKDLPLGRTLWWWCISSLHIIFMKWWVFSSYILKPNFSQTNIKTQTSEKHLISLSSKN